MATLADRVMDNGLSVLDTEANAVHLTSQEASTYAEATSTYSLGSATGISISAPSDRAGGGRKVTLAAITNGVFNANGTATHYAIVDTVNSRLLATDTLTASQIVYAGNNFALTTMDIEFTDPT
tara:strand:- start:469 stop:840 length:372 start_codon:yes stop_codon:yes gene_type:complete